MIKTNIQITTESLCDLPQQIYDQYNIHVIYNRIITEHGDFYDLKEITSSNLLEYLSNEKNKVTTTCPSVQEYYDFFSRECMYSNKLLHIATSSGISDSYTHAVKAAEDNDNIYVFDSGQLSGGIGILVILAAFATQNTNYIEDITSELENYRERVTSYSVINSMKYFQPDHFRKNISFRTFLMKILNHSFIHPVFHIAKGALQMKGIYLGDIKKYSIKFLHKELCKKNNIDTRLLIITYADCPYSVIKSLKNEILKYIEFEHILTAPMSAVTTSHCGSNTIAIFYITTN